jgi:hypothetical protein
MQHDRGMGPDRFFQFWKDRIDGKSVHGEFG